MKRLILEGKVFGKLTVQEYAGKNEHGHILYRCTCECGREKIFRSNHLRAGATTSCGCQVSRLMSALKSGARSNFFKHGKTKTRTYKSWSSMNDRVNNPNDPRYKDYGARGITICDRWAGAAGFQNFLADMGERPIGKTLDRRKNDEGYSPQNCRWATAKEQANNRRKRTA